MNIKAIFSNIANRIIDEIETAKQSVYIAVAWFTNKLIFEDGGFNNQGKKISLLYNIPRVQYK